MATKVLVLGGGSGGLVAANKVKRLLGREVEVTLVDKNAYHEFMPAYPWVAFGMREPEQVRRPLANLEKRGITYLQATVEALDPANNRVKTSAGELSYDYLIVSLGAEALPSPAQDGHAPWSLEGALKLREALKNFKGGRVVVGVSSPYYPCPPAPYEVAGQVEFALKVKGIRDKSTVEVFHLNPLPLAGMGPVISGKVMEILRSKGIAFHGVKGLADIGSLEVGGDDPGHVLPLEVGHHPGRGQHEGGVHRVPDDEDVGEPGGAEGHLVHLGEALGPRQGGFPHHPVGGERRREDEEVVGQLPPVLGHDLAPFKGSRFKLPVEGDALGAEDLHDLPRDHRAHARQGQGV